MREIGKNEGTFFENKQAIENRKTTLFHKIFALMQKFSQRDAREMQRFNLFAKEI